MSRSAHKEHNSRRSTYHTKISQQDVQQAIEQLDERLKQLKDNVIPPQPYLLSVPTDCPYRFHKSFINSWYSGTPFEPHEEDLQYMSFHSHQNIGEELLKVVGGWSDADGNLVNDESQALSRDQSLLNTPAQPPVRKKISLKDYKTKDKANPTSATADAVSKSSGEAMKADVKLSNSRVEEKVKSFGDGSRKHVGSDTRPTKLNRRPEAPPTIREPDSPSPLKRRRLSSEEPKSGDEISGTKRLEPTKEKKTLPVLLSPTLPASKSGRSNRALPNLLSPDLPKTLQIALADGQSKRSDHVKAVFSEAFGSATEKKSTEKTPHDTGRIRSDSQLSSKSLPPTAKTSPLLKSGVKSSPKPSIPILNGVTASPGPRQRHVIALKYGKKNRRRVEMLLRFPPKARKVKALRDESPSRKPLEPPDDSRRVLTTPTKSEKKRQPDPSPERPAKKLKAAGDTPDRPRTPTVSVKTPTTTHATKRPETSQATPRKELKPSAMQRVTSSDGVDAKTPPIDRGRTSTPVNSVQHRGSPAASSTPASRDSDRAAWNELNAKFHRLGKELKTEAQRLAPSTNETDQILSVVSHIEALLCFMISLSAQHHSRSSDSGWETIMPYFIAVFKASRRYRHLHGLVIQLGAICRQVWHGHNIEKLSRDPLPDESSNSAPTPGSDGNTRTDDTERYRRRYLDFRTQLVQNSRELQKAWLEGSRCLSPYLLAQEYPRTWSKRTEDTSRRSFEKINPAKIDKEFYLPLDPNSTVFEATRFALFLMKEWTEKENVTWKAKIEF